MDEETKRNKEKGQNDSDPIDDDLPVQEEQELLLPLLPMTMFFLSFNKEKLDYIAPP